MHAQGLEPFSILLVDDDPTVVRLMGLMLSPFTPLRFATSGQEALKRAVESIPDLVLLDVEMPDLSGFEVCKAIKRTPALAKVPVIFVTSHSSTQLQSKGLEFGAVDFIEKPVSPPLLMARVRTYQRLKTLSETIRGAVRLDFLTGTATRREFERVTTQEWLRASRTAAPLSLLIADIDGFGAYNAEFGEDRADLCLRRVADALRSVARRPADLIGRYAGGRFAILLPETRVSGARVVAQRAIEAVDSLQIRHAAACTRNRVTLFVGGSYREPVAGVAAEVAASIPDDLRVAAEQACDIARSASDDVARFVDVVHLRTRPPDGTTV